MPVTFSSKKALRRDRRRQGINQRTKSNLKKQISNLKKKPNKQNLSLTYRLLDRAAKKNLFHPNKTARLKSSLARKFSTLKK